MDAGNMIKPMLARGELRMVGATTLDEYREHIEKDAALERRFQQVHGGRAKRRGHHRHPAWPQGPLRGAPRCPDHRRRPGRRGQPSPTATSPRASCRTRRSTWSTRPRPGCGWRSTPGRWRSTRSNEPCGALRSRRWRWPRKPTRLRTRLAALRAELAEKKEELSALTVRWQNEKCAIEGVRELKEQLEALRGESERAERDGDLGRTAELRYGRIPALEKELAGQDRVLRPGRRSPSDAQGGGRPRRRRRRRVRLDRHSGGRLLEGKPPSCCGWRTSWRTASSARTAAVRAVSDAVRRASCRRGGSGSRSVPLFLGPTGVGKTELAEALATFLFEDERARSGWT